jgi:cysteine-rich repeat protein
MSRPNPFFVFLVTMAAIALFSACSADDNSAGGGGSKTEAGADGDVDADAGGEIDSSVEPDSSADASEDAETDASDSGTDAPSDAPTIECGNLAIEPPEECDDGNKKSGDGCSSDCKLESTGPEDICPGETMTLTGTGTAPRIGSASASTSSVLNQYSSGCGGSGKDYVYVVTPDVTGLLTATLSADFDGVLHARSTCDDTSTELGCADDGAVGGAETISFGVSANSSYYLFVDGYAGSGGPFTLDVKVDTAFCGNGVAESPENCDDGNMVLGDGCDTSCMLEPGGIVDDCPGSTFVLSGPPNAPRKLSIVGNTKGKATSQSPTSCLGSGPNDVYGITPDIAGSMKVSLVAAFDNATLHVRSDCDSSTAQLDCIEGLEPFDFLSVNVPVLPNQTFYVIVDGQSSTASLQNFGPYSLQIEITPAACGNDALDGNEECDDGNAAVGDGCDATCALESAGTDNDVCPGATLALVSTTGGTESGVVTASTELLVGDYQAKSTTCASKLAKDAVYAVTPTISGTLTATVNGQFDSAVYVQKVCGSTVDELICGDKFDGNSAESVGAPVLANQTYYVVVDSSLSTQQGVFELAVNVVPGVCGNGIIDGGEDCDDSNALAGDGCDATCKLEPVGANDNCPAEVVTLVPNGAVSTATVKSGTVNLFNDFTHNGCTGSGPDAVYAITPATDGVVTATIPDAKFNVSLVARSACLDKTTQITCANTNTGNGGETITFSVQANQTYYVIVDGVAAANIGTFTLDLTLSAPGCGDGLISGTETCDDGNTNAGDGCDATCQLEPTTGNDVCPGKVITLVGSGTDTRLGIFTGTTEPLIANYAGTCGGGSREAVFVVTSDVNGSLKAELLPTYKAVLYARETCNDAVSEVKCDAVATTATGLYDITFPVLANVPYYLFVDGFGGEYGAYTLKIAVEP